MAGLSQLRVLIVEEEAGRRHRIAEMLRELGCPPADEADDGRDGLVMLESAELAYDLLMCNLDMAGMDGLEFIRHAARLGVGGLILFSEHDEAVLSSAEWMARAYDAPLLGALRAPIDKEALAPLIERLHGNLTVYSDVVGSGYPVGDQRAIEEIETALALRQFVPHYQPKVCLTTGAVRGAEALVRWEHPELGLLAPTHFVDLTESSGLIEPLTHLVLEQAGRDAMAWAQRGLNVQVSVNVSPLTLEMPNCAKQLLETIARTGAQPTQFTIEITEKAFARDAATVLENVLRLRMRGCGVAVDDFGTGYSSLQQLHRTPITELKLDRSFVRRLKSNSKAQSIIESTLDLARKLKLKTVAEGIDNDEQRRWLASLGCQTGQGYFFARPMEREQFEAWCRRRQPLAA